MEEVHKILHEEIGKNANKNNKNVPKKQDKKELKIKINKTKQAQKKSPNKKPNQKHGRRKREAVTENLLPSSVTLQQFYPENFTDSLLNIVVTTTEYATVNESSLMKISFNSTTNISNTKVTNNDYYKYSVEKYLNNPTTTQPTKFDKIYNNTNISASSVNNNKSNDANNITVFKDEENKKMVNNMLNLKFSIQKWEHLKLHLDKEKNLKKEIFIKNMNQKHNPVIENDVPKPKVGRKDVPKIIVKKTNLKKVLNITHFIPTKGEMKSYEINKMPISYCKLSDIQYILKQILKKMYCNNATVNGERKTKGYKINIFKTMKTLMNRIFGKIDTTENKNINFNLNKHHILEIICKNMKLCGNVKAGNMLWLRSKIRELNAETNKILRIIRTMKGLLHLVDIPKNVDKVATENSNFSDDVYKLSMIVKGTYIKGKMSNTDILLTSYIMKHTQDFIKSFGKCVDIINEIISIITDNNNIKKFGANDKIDNLTQNKYIQNFKRLFMRYNLLQHRFMRKMYQLLIEIENNSKKHISHEVNHNRDRNKNVAIEDSKKLIEKLRRLKTLAQTLRSSRRKRDTQYEDTMEYMLIMMEYLLKQNYQLNTAPVNDGIDLLIEAIKSAPDIKPIKKKVLENTPPTIITVTRTIKPMTSNIRDNKYILNYKKISNNEQNLSSSDKFTHDEMKRKDKNNYKEDVGNKNRVSNIKGVYKKPLENPDDIDKVFKNADDIEKGFESTEIINDSKEYDIKTVDNVKKLETYRNERTHGKDENENTNIGKFKKPGVNHHGEKNVERAKDEVNTYQAEKPGVYIEDRKYEVFAADNDKEKTADITLSKVEEETTEAKIKYVTIGSTTNSYDVTSGYKQSKLEWIEEAFDKEMKEYNEAMNTTTTPKPTRSKPTKYTKKDNNVSDMWIETENDYKKKVTKIDTEEVMLKKQMDLLNSLDYGTEKPDFDDADSKEGSDAGDSFATYFV